uniref:Ig-like domain-containing protein n=1 Tax=Macrostomum lignano TaxID=282301 RepID=A0A1I8FDJ5_9PLAT
GVTQYFGLGADWLRQSASPPSPSVLRDVWHQAGKTRSLRKLKRLYFYWICPTAARSSGSPPCCRISSATFQRMDGDDYAQLLDIRVHLHGQRGDSPSPRDRQSGGTSIGIFFCGPGQLAKDLNGRCNEFSNSTSSRRPRPRPLRRRVAAGPRRSRPASAQPGSSWSAHETQCSTTCGQGVRCRPPRLRVDMNDPKLGAIQLWTSARAARKAARKTAAVGEWVRVDRLPSSTPPRKPSKRLRGSPPTPPPLPWSAAPDDAAQGRAGRASTWRRMRENIDGARSRACAMPARRATRSSLEEDCGKAGSRTRVRRCDRPPPDSKGSPLRRRQPRPPAEGRTARCPCSADTDFLAMAKEMLAQDLTETPPTSCSTLQPGLSIVKPYQHLQINWRRNNVSVIALQTRLQWFMAQSEEAKGLLTGSDEASKAVSRHTKLEMAQVRSFGTQLTIDPVDADKVGLYACYMLTDKSYPELQTVVMATNAGDLHGRPAAVNGGGGGSVGTRTGCQSGSTYWQTGTRGTGPWRCPTRDTGRLGVLPGAGQPEQWKTNEFKLSISKQLFFLQKFNDAYLAYFIAGCALILYAIVGFPLAGVTLEAARDGRTGSPPRSSAALSTSGQLNLSVHASITSRRISD